MIDRRSITILAILFPLLLLLASCATLSFEGDGHDLPPILAQDELIRPYIRLARIQIQVETYVVEPGNLQEWGFRLLREEAAKMGADAVVLPEVSVRPTNIQFFPSNEYRVTGVPIKFK